MLIRDKVYNKLKSLGLTDSKEDFFNYYDSDESVRKDVYQRLKEDGLRNTEDEFYAAMNPQKDIQKSEDDAVFEANAERFRNGQPIERVTTQSVIDANPELELGDQPYQYKPEVQEHILKNKPDMFKPKQSLMDAPLGINAPEGSDEKFQARINVAQKNLQDPEYQKGRVKSEFRVLSDSVNADLEKIEDAITSRQKAVRNIDWKPGMPSSRDDAKLTELRGQRTYLEGAKELIEDSQNILNAVEAEKDGNFFGGLGRGVRDKAFDIDTWTMGLSDLVGGLRLKSVLEKAEKGETLTSAEEKLLDASVNNMAVNFYYRNDLGLGYQAGEITGQSIPFMLEFLVNPVSASGNAMAKRLLTYGLKRFGSAVNSKAIKVGTRLATDALAAGGVTATTGMGHVLSGGVERLNRNYEYGLDEEGNLNVVNTHNMSVGEAFAKSAASAFLERQSEMIFNAFRGAPSLFKGIEASLPGGVNTFMNYVSSSRLGELWRGIKNNATMKELAKRTQFHGLGEEYLEEVYNNFANIPLGEMTFEEATDLENNIVTFLGLAPTQVMFSAIGGIGYGVERYKAKRDLERTFGKMTEEQKRKLMELQEMGKLSTNKDIAFFLAETIKDESLTPEQKRAEIEYAYNLAKQNAIDEVSNTDVEDSIESENQQIDAATDPQTGMYGEVMLTSQDLDGNNVVTPANVFGEKEVNGELYLLVLPEGEAEKKWVRPNQYDVNSYQKRSAEEVKAINEEMIREEAAKQAEQEAKYAPEVLNAQMPEGEFTMGGQLFVPSRVTSDGVVYDIFDLNEKGKPTTTIPIESRPIAIDEYRDMLQAQLNAEEAAQEQISAEEQAAAPEVVEEVQPTEEVDVKENLTTESSDNLSPVEEVAQPQAEVQTPVIPTKEDGSIDFVSYGKEGTFKTLGEKYGEKMPNKVAVTAKALAEDLKNAQNKLQKAEEAYDNAPIGREQKAEEARDKAKQELEAIQREANFWAEMDAEIKDAQARRESMLNPQAEVETSTEPMNVDEFVAQQLASGNIVLDKEDYKKETGYGDVEANAMNGGATKLFGKNGMTIQEAGERLMEIDRENGTNFFDQLDSNSGRDALINVLGSVKSRNELNQYIATNRAEQAKKESEGLRNELEKQAMEANYASLEDYVLQMEAAEMENPFLNDRADEIMAIFAEEAAKYEQSLNNTENGQGTENEVVEGNDSILPEEQLDNTGGTEVSEESERIGDGTSEESESTHAATEVELKQEEGETTLQFAERAAEENRRRPLRKRAEEWSNTLGIKVTYLESIDDVDAKTRAQIEAAHAKGESVPGWVNKKGEVFFFMPDLSDLKDVDDTYIHEVVAHVGLPQLLGKERFGELCDKVWEMMPQSAKDYYISYPGVKNHRDAADEYIAHLAEQQNLTPEEKTIWDNIVKMFREMLDKALNGIISKSKLTDEDISNLIKASYANLKSGAEGNVSGEGTKFRAKWRKGQLDKASRTIRRWLENNTRGKSFEIELPKATLDKVRKAMGRDFESHNITSNGIVHALKNHGENGLKLTGISIPLSKEDVELIPYIMTSPDRVEKASTDASGRESVRFYKDLSNGYVVVVEKEYKNSPDDMETITMWAELSSKATNAQQNAAPDTHVRNAILSIDIAKIRKDAEDAIEEDENLKEKTSFRVVKDKNGNKSLVGLHNISEAKLKKAIKQGGLANPSMAVIDMDKQSHVDYGDITLVAPSSLIDKKTGKNIGTYTADAWTPIYPNIEKRMSDKGAKAYSESLESVPSELRNKVRLYFNAYLEDGNTSGALNYWFLNDTGKNPPSLTSQSNDYTNEELDAIEAIGNAGYYSGLNEEEKQKVLDLFIEKQGGKDAFDARIAERIETMKNNLQRPDLKAFMKNKVEQKLQEIQEYGYDYEQVSDFYSKAQRAINNRGKIDEFRTFRNAQDIVNNEGLQGEFNEWLADKEEQFGVEEYLFVGYNNNGDRKYLPNTLENASKLMKKEGRAGATGLHGFNHFVATLAPNAGTLAQINKKKGNLSTQEEYDAFREKWGDVYHELANQLQPDATGYADYGYYRLEEMPTVKNPKEFVKKEYGIELSDEFMKKYNEFVSAIKNDFPARYFETKFERPVYLNEFAAAVVPQGTSKDVVDALTEVGLPIEEYESGNNEARMAAVDKVTIDNEGVRFRVSNRNQEIFVSNAQRAVEGIKQEKATPQQWLAMIEKNSGLKAGEDKWLGLSDWLKASDKKSVSKDEIFEFIDQNKIRIEEVHYGGKDMSAEDIKKTSDYKALVEDLTEYDSDGNPYISEEKYNYLVKETFDFKQGFKLVDGKLEIKRPYAASLYLDIAPKIIEGVRLDYTTKGLENKEEIALTVPTIGSWNVDDNIHFGDAGEGRAIAWIRFGETTIEDKALTEKSKILGSKEWWNMSEEERKSIMDELKNLKQNSRSTRVLVIDEIQSKRHQEGRDKGYMPIGVRNVQIRIQNIEERLEELGRIESASDYGLTDEQLDEQAALLAEERKLVNSGTIPAAPFEKNWSELAFKRMLRYAAENGFDKLAWTTGAQQAERYNLGSVIDSVSISKSKKEDGKYHITSWDKETMPIGIASGNKTPEELKALFGKEIAQSLIEGVDNLEEGSDTFVLEGASLEVGGEGMKGFYDKMLPSFVNKYVKKWGTKVQDIELPNVEESGRIMHSVDVTEAMKESVMEGQTMFRISEKGKQIQTEVDKFTSKYNSKPVRIVEAEMDDNELMETLDYAFELEDVKSFMKESKTAAGYFHNLDKIIIFADKTKVERMEEYLFHENIHAAIHHNNFANLVAHFYEYAKNEAVFEKWSKLAHNKEYKQYNSSEEFLAYVVSNAMVARNLDEVAEYLGEKQKKALNKLFNVIGYDYDIRRRSDEQSVNGRTSEETSGESSLEGNELLNTGEGRGTGNGTGKGKSGKVSAAERKARLNELFNKVADMGLQGVLGNKEYTSLMVDIYKALPEGVRAEIAEYALRLYGGSVAPAVSDYIGPKSKNSIMDKVVTIVREALRKIGFDLDLNANEVRYMAWRSKKPLDRNNMFEVAEDIDMKYRLKVGEYDGTTPDGGGTRFRVTPKMDAEYMEAVNSGDIGKAQRMVLEAAKMAMPNTKVVDENGYPKVVYHNTKREFYTFDPNSSHIKNSGFWFSEEPFTHYGDRLIPVFLNLEDPNEGTVPYDIELNVGNKKGLILRGETERGKKYTFYIANLPSQIKSADSVTYDDNGNVIPLSKRFKKRNKDIRFRVSNKLQVRDEYEATIKKGGYQAREAVQDAMLSLRKFQELIEKASGKKIRDFENAWMHENRLSSVVQAEIHDMERKFYKPMMDAVKKLMSAANLEQEQVADYLMLKHGIERNREMAVRKALTDDKGKIDRTRLEQWYQDKDAIRNDATLDTWRKKQEAMDNAALNYGADMSRDYSGLTSMFDTDDIEECTNRAYDEVEALETAHQVETESLRNSVKAMTQNTLDKSFESGLMDRKVYDELSKDMYDYYIPLRGFEETTSEEVYAYLDQDRGAFNAPLKRAKGRSSKSDNPIAYLKSIAESGIMQGNRNKMKQSFLNMVINHPSDLVSVREGVWVIYNPATGEWEAASAPAIPNNATPADVEAAMEAWEQQMEQAAQNDPNIKKVSEAADVPYRVVGNRMDQHQIIVKRLGKSYTLTVNGNPRLAMAINGQTNPNNTSNDGKVAAFVNNKIGALNRSLAAWYTTRNPDFVASNFMRDTFYTNTIVRAKEGNAYANKFHKNYATVLPKMLGLFRKYENGTLNPADQTEAAFLDFMMNGGETGYSNLKDLEEIKKQIAKELKGNRFAKVEALAEKLDILNRAVENTARFAAYLTSREEGRSIAKSVFDAKEISVNFNKKGAGGTFFGMTGQTWFGNLAAMVGAGGRALYVFFNAAIQGTTNLMHVMKVNPKGTSAGLAAMFLMGAVIPFLFDDDDEKDYYDLPEHVRRNHLIIPGTGDAWISIPLPIEYRIMYGMGELLTSWITGHERGTDIARKMLSMSGQALPLNFLEEGLEAFVPSAVSPIYQVMTNSSWTGLPIYKENDFNKDDPEYTKAYSNVDRNLLKFTKALYEWSFDEENQKERIDLNPAIIETLAKGYFGGLATQLSNIAKVGGMIAGEQEFDWRNIPIGNRILKTGDERTKEKRVTNEYFENMEKLDFLQSRERMLKKTEKGVAVPESDRFKAQKDLETMQGTEVYKKYQEFKKQKKVVDKIRKTIKEKGSTPEREKQLMEAQEAANKSVR